MTQQFPELPIKYNDVMATMPFSDYLTIFKSAIHNVFPELLAKDPFTSQRGIPHAVSEKILPLAPISVVIPREYGGRGSSVLENLAITSAAAYESLAYALTMGINSALFMQPFIKYASNDIKSDVLKAFLFQSKMGGLMITEPDYGSDALNMQSNFEKVNSNYHLKGIKHWAGLTGSAQYWILTAREKTKQGQLSRDMGFFLRDVSKPNQSIVVEEFYDNLGLHHIPYGKNIIDVLVPEQQMLLPQSSGLVMLLDILHRSRLQFPAMALGFIERMLDEAIAHCKQRFVGGKSLFEFDQVQLRIAHLQSAFCVCSAFCNYSSKHAGIENNLASAYLEANAFKAYATDLMQEAAQSLVQMVGAKAYRFSHIGGRGIIDSRPFQIFEGSNDMLYAQMGEAVQKNMKQLKVIMVSDYIVACRFTKDAPAYIVAMFQFAVPAGIKQRSLVDFGRAFSRLIAIQMLLELKNTGFRNDLIDNSITLIAQEISAFLALYQRMAFPDAIIDYKEQSSWFE